MKKITLIAMFLVIVVVGTFAQDSERKSNLTITCIGYEGTEMVGCYEYVYLRVHNETNAVECIPADEGLHVFYTDFLENDEVKYTHVGEYYEDIVVQPGESIDIKIRATHIKSKGETQFGVIGTFLDNSNRPTRTFTTVQFDVEPARDWDLTGTVQIEQVNNADEQKVVAHATLTNNEATLFTPFHPFTRLYRKTSSGSFVQEEINTIRTNWYEPGISYNEDIEFGRVKNGYTYYVDIRWNHYIGVNPDYVIARSEVFTFGETSAITTVAGDEGLASIYTADGKLVAVGDADDVMHGLGKGLYIIKDNQGTRKVMK